MSVFINNEFQFTIFDNTLSVGDIGFSEFGSGGLYLDQVRMRVLSTSLIGTPPNSELSNYRQAETVDGFFGKQERIFNEDLVRFKHGVSQSSKMFLSADEDVGNTLLDQTSNRNNGEIRNGTWVEEGYFGQGVQLINGDIKITDDSSISDLSEFMLHMRFKLSNLEVNSRSLAANPIASKGAEWTIYDYKKEDGLIAHFKFNNNHLDSSGYNHKLSTQHP